MQQAIIIGVLLMAGTSMVSAKPISREQARQQAVLFMQQRGDWRQLVPTAPAKMRRSASAGEANPYYVFDRGQHEGFVIVAGDDASPETVLGYCDKGAFDYDQLPPAMQELLDDYTRQIEALGEQDAQQTIHRVPTHPVVPQLMTCTWNQGSPYNDACPIYFDQKRSVTGCVATAYAQILYYQRSKMVTETQAAMPAYDTWTEHATYGHLHVQGIPEGSHIDWDNMKDNYGSATDVQRKAVADLMHYCGVGVKMDYTSGASGAQSADVYNSLVNYFGFRGNQYLRYVGNASSDEEWDALVYNDLAEGRPVYISGANSEAGHAFVCDGYDGQRRFHINWGWGGQSDGYYYLSNLTPGQQGIGGSSDGYNQYREIIIGIEPENYADKTMDFSDATARRLCTDAWDADGDGRLTYGEAAQVSTLGTVLKGSSIKNFTELHYFTALTTLDDEAFMGCKQLTSVKLPRQLQAIGSRAFKDCTKLQPPTLPERLNTIGEEAFMGCTAISAITLPQNLRTIGARAFDGCNKLSEMTLPNGIRQLGDEAFASCTALVSFTIRTIQPQAISMGSQLFSNIDLQGATLHVMQGTRAFFAADEQWSKFGTIKETRDLSHGEFAPLTEGQQVYLYHVGSGRYLTKGEAWGTQAIVGSQNPMRFTLRHSASMPEGTYTLYSNDTGNDRHYLFRTNNDGNVGQGVQAAFVDGNLDERAHWAVSSVADNTYTISIPQGYDNYQAGNCWGVQTDHESHAASPTWGVYSDVPYEGHELDCQWRFVTYDAAKTANYQAALTLQALIDMAVSRHIVCDTEQAVLDNLESTTEELKAAQRMLRKKLNLMDFADEDVRQICTSSFDTDADGEISVAEASMVDDIAALFKGVSMTSFDELQYFTSLTALYGQSFEGCKKLTSIKLPESLERIYYRVFLNCSALTEIHLPEYINTIGDNAFDGCTGLKTVAIDCPDPAMISLGNNVFRRLTLKDLTLLVPVGSKELYEQAEVWKEFGTIKEVRTHTQPKFSPISEGAKGYVMNLATRKFLTKGEAYGTQAVVGRQGMLYEWRHNKSMADGQYYLYSNQTGKDGKVLFRTSTDSKVGEGVKTCFVDGSMGASAYWQVDSVDNNIYTLQVPATDASYVDGEYLGTDSYHQSGAASPTNGIYWDIKKQSNGMQCQWAFITQEDMQAAKDIDASIVELKGLLEQCEKSDIEKNEEQAVYDNLQSTPDEILAAIASLRAKLHYITFADNRAKTICLDNWDMNGDGELTLEEAAQVTTLGEVFRNQSGLKSLEELRYFTQLTEIPANAFRNSSSLVTICLPEQVKTLGEYAFTGCSALKYVVLLAQHGVVPVGSSSVRSTAVIFVPEALVANYEADEKWQKFSISAYTGKPVVKALPASRQYGRSAASLKYEVKGAPINGEPELSCAEITVTTTPVGTYDILVAPGTITTPGLTCEMGEFSVIPAPLTITAQSYTVNQGEASPAFEVSYKGFRNHETNEVLLQQPVVSCVRTTDSPAGQYDIVVSGAEAQNYDITYVNGVLTVVSDPSAIRGITTGNGQEELYDLQGRKVTNRHAAKKKAIYVNGQKRKVILR